MRASGAALIALLLASPFTLALASPPTLDVAARVEDGRLVVDARSSESGEVTLVVTHDDPLVGPVVDRVVKLDLAANASVSASVADPRFGVGLTVRVLAGAPDLPTLGVEGLLNASAIVDLPALELPIAPIPPEARSSTVRVPAYPQGRDVYASEDARVLVTPEGRVALTWLDQGALWLATSHDGGRSFSAPILLVEKPIGDDAWGTVWYAAQAHGERIVVLAQPRLIQNGTTMGEGWRVLTIDPAASPRIVSEARLGEPDGLRFDMYAEQLHSTRAGLLLTFVGIVENGTQSLAPVGRAAGSDVQVWRVGEDGRATRVGGTSGAPHFRSFRVVASPSGDHLALVGAVGPDDNASLVVARSSDGGRSFWDARRIDGVAPARHVLDVHSAALDDAGTLHAVAMGYPYTGVSGPVWFDAWYARVPLAGPVASRALGPTVPPEHLGGMNVSILWPTLATVGPRVTLAFDSSAALYFAESLDGGLTWGPSLRLEGPAGYHQIRVSREGGMGILPDGRPVLVGHAGDARYPPKLATVLPYDPLPPAAQALVALANGTIERATTLTLDGPRDAALPSGGNASLYLYARNEGATEARADVVLTGLPPGVRFVSGMTRLVLGPGESGGFGLLFLDEGAAPANARVSLVLRDEGRNVSAPFPIDLAIGGAAAPPEDEAEPEPERAAEQEPSPTPIVATVTIPRVDPNATKASADASEDVPDAPTPIPEPQREVPAAGVALALLAAALAARRSRR